LYIWNPPKSKDVDHALQRISQAKLLPLKAPHCTNKLFKAKAIDSIEQRDKSL